MQVPKTWKGVLNSFRQAPQEIQDYFPSLPGLLNSFPWDVCLAYMFARLELAHNMAIYCGVVKLHRAEISLAWKAVENQHMTRKDFRQFFTVVMGKPISKLTYAKLEKAEKIRDKVLHGKVATPAQMREAAVNVLSYAEDLNQFVSGLAGFQPFDDLRGFKGRAQSLDVATTRWLLKGMGFSIS